MTMDGSRIVGLIEATERLKREMLVDLLRRVIANRDKPRNLELVAEAIAKDWSPPIKVNPDGRLALNVSVETEFGGTRVRYERTCLEQAPL